MPNETLELLRDDEEAMDTGAVDELLRFLTVSHFGRRRVAVADLEIAGSAIRAGEGIIVATNIGNRDESAWPDADRLDLLRRGRGHLAFGFGPHSCLGGHLARTQIQIALGTLHRRVPDLSLGVHHERLRFRHEKMIYGVHDLPVVR